MAMKFLTKAVQNVKAQTGKQTHRETHRHTNRPNISYVTILRVISNFICPRG